ncbi:phosphotransferase [Kribbella sp. NPDC056861]|uniref:phosphotransferase n=1 Tax=Kribbella sp. NPDC056861 TaxID=3154857 RepID=UPI00342C28BB
MSGAPLVDYTATSARPPWSALPDSLRTALAVALGTEIAAAGPSVTSGFTGGFAAPLYLADGREVFVKAAENSQHAYSAYQREAELVPNLPAAVRAPRILATAHATAPTHANVSGTAEQPAAALAPDNEARWFAVASERVDARMPGMPWTREDFATVTKTCETMADALTPTPFTDLEPFTAQMERNAFPRHAPAEILAGQRPLPDGFHPWLPDRLQELQDLINLYPTALQGDSAVHGDLRPDNLFIDSTNTCWTVDWNWLSLAPPWFDWVGLLPLAHRDGIDTLAAINASPLTNAVPADDLDCFAATIAAYMMDKLDAPPPPGCTPELRRHQRNYAWAFLDWLAVRRDWV